MWDNSNAYECFLSEETETGEKAAKEEAVVENTTPDYAAGLVSAQVCVIRSTVLSGVTPLLYLSVSLTYSVYIK